MKRGDRVELVKRRYDGSEMWRWEGRVWHAADGYVLFYDSPGTPVQTPEKAWVMTMYGLMHFWPGKPYFIWELYDGTSKSLREWFCNINLPPVRTERGYAYVDLDLDLVVRPDLSYEVVDQDEYAENSARYGYPPEVRELVERTLEGFRTWVQERRYPFRGAVGLFDAEAERVVALCEESRGR